MKYYLLTDTKELVPAPMGKDYCSKVLAKQGRHGVLASELPIVTARQADLFFPDYVVRVVHVVTTPIRERRHTGFGIVRGATIGDCLRPAPKEKPSKNLALGITL